jgi:hypothetical protein
LGRGGADGAGRVRVVERIAGETFEKIMPGEAGDGGKHDVVDRGRWRRMLDRCVETHTHCRIQLLTNKVDGFMAGYEVYIGQDSL